MERFNSGITDIFKMEIDDYSKSNFIEMSRWTKFLAVVFFTISSIAVVAGVFLSFLAPRLNNASQITSAGTPGPAIIITSILVGIATNFFPAYSLLKYSSNVRSALKTGNKDQFNAAIRHLKNMFKYVGILMIIMLLVYGIGIALIFMGAS